MITEDWQSRIVRYAEAGQCTATRVFRVENIDDVSTLPQEGDPHPQFSGIYALRTPVVSFPGDVVVVYAPPPVTPQVSREDRVRLSRRRWATFRQPA